ncbi:hypothetical protein [Streptomyces chartreusis]
MRTVGGRDIRPYDTGSGQCGVWLRCPEARQEISSHPDATALDDELVFWAQGRPTFERLQDRLHRRDPETARAADIWPTHFVAFDLLRLGFGRTTTTRRSRRAAQPGSAHQ